VTRRPSPKHRLCTSPSGVELWYTEHRNPDGSIGGLCGPNTRVCSKSFVSPDSIVHDKAQVTDSTLTEGCRVAGESSVEHSTLIASRVGRCAKVVTVRRSELVNTNVHRDCAVLDSTVHDSTIEGDTELQRSFLRWCTLRGHWAVTDSKLRHVNINGRGRLISAVVRDGRHLITGFDCHHWAGYRTADGVMLSFGCETHPVSVWRRKSEDLAREHEPCESAYFARKTKRLAAYVAATLARKPKKKARPATKKKAKKARSK